MSVVGSKGRTTSCWRSPRRRRYRRTPRTEMTRARGGGVPWTISLTLRRRRPGRRQVARRSQEEGEEIAPRGRRSLTPRLRLTRPSYGHWGSMPSAQWAHRQWWSRRQWGRCNCPRRGSRGHRSPTRVGRHQWMPGPCLRHRRGRCRGEPRCRSGCNPARVECFFSDVRIVSCSLHGHRLTKWVFCL